MNLRDAISIIESASGFTDESTPVGEAWKVILGLVDNKEACPDCGRVKAKNFADIENGYCPKWYAIRDAEAERDCVLRT